MKTPQSFERGVLFGGVQFTTERFAMGTNERCREFLIDAVKFFAE